MLLLNDGFSLNFDRNMKSRKSNELFICSVVLRLVFSANSVAC